MHALAKPHFYHPNPTASDSKLEPSFLSSLRALAQDKAWQSIHSTHSKSAESKRHKLHTSTYSLHTFLESTFSHDTLFLSSRDFRKEVVAIHKSAKADSKKNTQKVETLESTFEKTQMDCHAIATALTRNDSNNAPTLKTPAKDSRIFAHNAQSALIQKPQAAGFADDFGGFQAVGAGIYLSGNEQAHRAESTKSAAKPTPKPEKAQSTTKHQGEIKC